MSGDPSAASSQLPHVIRLRGPWRTDTGRRISLPATWQATLGDSQRATLTRSFNWVRDLADVNRVALRLQSPHKVERLLVNDNATVEGHDLRPLLEASNQLLIELARQDGAESVLDVWLEVTEIEA